MGPLIKNNLSEHLNRAYTSQEIHNQTGGYAGDQRIHRSLLQPAEETGKAGIFIPRCL